jgi:hypothetical protein
VNKTATVMTAIAVILMKHVIKLWGENYIEVIVTLTGILSFGITHVDMRKIHKYINR